MNTFQSIVSIGAAFAVVANAACTIDRAQDCIDFEEMQQAVETMAGDYTWRFYTVDTEDENTLRLFRFMGDETGVEIDNQWEMGPVLLLNTATRDCRHWFTETVDYQRDIDSIPKQLFDAGYDVWIGCKRATIYSDLYDDDHHHEEDEDAFAPPFMLKHTEDNEEDYFDFNTGTIGENDVPAFVRKILEKSRNDETNECMKVQIIGHSLGGAEALVTLSSFPVTSERLISHLINLAPCPIPTYQQADDRRVLQATSEVPRELSEEANELVDEKESRLLRRQKASKEEKQAKKDKKRAKKDKKKKKEEEDSSDSSVENFDQSAESGGIALNHRSGSGGRGGSVGHSGRNRDYQFWDRTERYCTRYPDNCSNFCTWYPHKCDEFCERFPQWCTPEAVSQQCRMNEIFHDLEIYSKYGPDWEEQVEAVCEEVEWWTCNSLRNTVDQGYAEMSLQQLDHMWQISYAEKFVEYNPDFCESQGWREESEEFPLEDISGVVISNFYVDNDPYCKPETQQAILDPLSEIKYTMMNEAITHTTIAVANNQTFYMNLLKFSLSQGVASVEGECTDLGIWY